MKRLFSFFIVLILSLPALASHIAGGELFYEYLGAGNTAGTNKYRITMRLFRDCFSTGATFDQEGVLVGIYNAANNAKVTTLPLPLQRPTTFIQLHTNTIPCLTNPPDVCFEVGLFIGTIDLQDKPDGYILSWIRCCRSDNLANLSAQTGVGATYVTNIPGTNLLPSGHNSSPQFLVKDTALVCANKNFTLDFGSIDADGDQLTYSFCNAYSGATSSAPNPGFDQGSGTYLPNNLPDPLKLTSVSYKPPYSGSLPLGANVSIDPVTGKITGTAPAAGRYVIAVCVTETRNGVVINTHRKDFILAIGNCDYAAANPVAIVDQPNPVSLPYKYVACNGFDVEFRNFNNSPTIKSFMWDFGVPGITTDTSSLRVPIYVYPDTGIYLVTLKVVGAAGCEDIDTVRVGVYPGFTADFQAVGGCYQKPFQFFDASVTHYGVTALWKWDFGDLTTNKDTSSQKNPIYQYASGGIKNVTFSATSMFGCSDTITKAVTVLNAPPLTLPFKDTLICSIDTLSLVANGTGVFSWSPLYNIINPNTSNPLVYPKDTTRYIVTLSDSGCVRIDTITVNVLDFITIDAGNDTTICKTDDIVLNPTSYALQYIWTPSEGIISGARTKNPLVRPDRSITYHVTANLGKCQDKDSVTIRVVPYPVSVLSNDVTLCYGETTQLQGQIVGSSFTWSPAIWLSSTDVLNPVASPKASMQYILTVRDTLGCPKPKRDTVEVTVVPKVVAFAGNDTVIVANQPLQLNATGGTLYTWTPAIGMDSPFTSHPIVILGPEYDSVTYTVRVSVPFGCYQDDKIKVVVFKTQPDLFIPSAFTPNGDGRNDIIKPIAVGIKDLLYFRIFNRWGQLVFSTNQIGDGWDGRYNNKDQATGTFVYAAQAVDYKGRPITKKGTIVLIR